MVESAALLEEEQLSEEVHSTLLAEGGTVEVLLVSATDDYVAKVDGVVEAKPKSEEEKTLSHLPVKLLASTYLGRWSRELWQDC
jgi:hypothetical protein